MAGVPEIGEKTKITLDLKTIGMVVGFTISLSTMWFTLKADIATAMENPKPPIERVEYDLKDELIRPLWILKKMQKLYQKSLTKWKRESTS